MLMKRKRGKIGAVTVVVIILILVMAGMLYYAIWKSAMATGGLP